ncbi:MAG: restriction endonuclease subunit S [Gammaproteobacteria bacterium]|nr:restriction endonuclease subunit S [Gammaproteobacteria bacterium]
MRLVDVADNRKKWSFIGGPFGSNLKSSDYVPEGIRVIQLQNIGDAEFLDDYKIFTSVEKADELRSNNIYPGEIILSKMGDPVGRACLIPDTDDRYVMCSDGIRLVINEKRYSKYFVYVSINSPNFRSLVHNTSTGSTRRRIGLDDLKNLPMHIPTLMEQRKIADCLGSLDDLISAQDQKLESLRQHKQGLLQQLFPQPGETVPKLRFPEFRNAPSWQTESLGDLGVFTRGLTYKSDDTTSAGLTVLRSSNIQDERLILNSDLVHVNKECSSRLLLAKGDIAICMSNGSKSLVGKNAEYIGDHIGNVTVGAFCSIFRAEVDFAKLAFKTPQYKTFIMREVAGGNIKNLTNSDLESFEFLVPRHQAEQRKIVDCLGSLDNLISAQEQKLETLRLHKQGLMQQLFPTTENL